MTIKPYWIVNDMIIFEPHFNESLDNYKDIISNYQSLIFSNYDNPYICLKNNNLGFNKSYYGSLFNYPLGDSLSNLSNLKVLTFGKCFNYSLGDSLSNLTNLEKLTFGKRFNYPLDNSLSNLSKLKVLILGEYFNQYLDNSLSNLVDLRKLTFGDHFNQPLIKFFDNKNDKAPENNCDYFLVRPLDDSLSNLHNLRKLIFGRNFNKPINACLSNLHNLRELTLGHCFNQHVDIPGWIKKLTVLNCKSYTFVDYLPSSVEELVLGHNFNLELDNLPSSIKKIKILNSRYDKKLNNLPTEIECLEISTKHKELITPIYKKMGHFNYLFFSKKLFALKNK